MSWLDAVNPQVNLLWAGPWVPGFYEAPRRLYDWELVYFAAGPCDFVFEGKNHVADMGTYLIVPPGKTHSTRAGKDGTFRHCIHFHWVPQKSNPGRPLFSMEGAAFDPAKMGRAPAFVPKTLLSGKTDRHAEALGILERFGKSWKQKEASARGIFLEALLFLLAPDVGQGERSGLHQGRENDLVYQVKACLDGTKEEDSIRKNLEGLGYSYEHLARLFKKQVGMSPLGYLHHRKIEEAKELLEEKGAEISQIAFRLGFNDPGYFARLFRKNTGLSPSAWAGR